MYCVYFRSRRWKNLPGELTHTVNYPVFLHTYITFTLIRFLDDWIIYPNSIFWSVWEKIMLVVIFFVTNWYMIAAAFFSYYTKGAYGRGTLGNLLFCFTYFCEALFVFDIFVSMKKANFVHMHHGKHLFNYLLIVWLHINFFYTLWIKALISHRKTYGQVTFEVLLFGWTSLLLSLLKYLPRHFPAHGK